MISRAVAIGIAGGSCAGKTALAEALARRMAGRESVIVPVDAYYHDLSHLPAEERARHDFDHPSAIDFDLFESDLRALSRGGGRLVPVYDYTTHTRTPRAQWRRVPPAAPGRAARVLIVEGLHALYLESVRSVYDLAVFVEAPDEIRLGRRLERDSRERGRTADEIRRRYAEAVTPMYERYVAPMREFADLVLDGSRPVTELAAEVVARLEIDR
jgi:uridine kinase